MREKHLTVTLPGCEVGELQQEAHGGLVTWVPRAAWIDQGQHPRLGLDFLRHPEPRRQGTGLPVWFENLLPEANSTLRRRLCAAHELREGQVFPLLGALGHDLSGAVEVHPKGTSKLRDSTPPRADDTEEDAEAPPSSREAIQRFSSLTGMQLKFSMSMVHENLVLPARAQGEQWIVKFPGPQFPDLPAVEETTMTWAKLAQFDVPPHQIVDVEQLKGIPPGWTGEARQAFAIKRFDRRKDGSKVHQEDLCQAFHISPDKKYGNLSPRINFEGALRLVTDVGGEAQGREMARRIGFMIASGNNDAHLKNWSLLWGSRTRPVLTPCYDLVATIAWPTMGWERHGGPELALRLGGATHFSQIDAGTLAAHGKLSGQPWAEEEIMTGIVRARDAWRTIADRAPPALGTALSVHWKHVPILRAIGW